MKKRLTYTTQQIDMKDSQQLRVTLGRRTVFIWANRRGLHMRDGGYAPKTSPGGEKIKRPKQMDLPL